MSLLNDILKWTEALPNWQRDACRRLFQKEDGLEEADYHELYSLMKAENGIELDCTPEPVPLTKDLLPADVAPGDKVTLVALRNLENVNQIPGDSALTFSEAGITVVYGGNGTGKSGYARVMKRACRARDQSELVHPNAKDPAAAAKEPTAKFDVVVAGVAEEVTWTRDSTPPERLSSISVFDSKCARSYITAERDVAYLPYGLDIVENLANQVIPKLSQMLEAEIEGIDVSKLPFEHLLVRTEAGKAIEGLSAQSDADAIKSLGTLSEDEIRRIDSLRNALKVDDPLAKAEDARRSAKRLKAYAEKLAKPLNWVSAEAVTRLKKLQEEKSAAEDAENKAAVALRAGEELYPVQERRLPDAAWIR